MTTKPHSHTHYSLLVSCPDSFDFGGYLNYSVRIVKIQLSIVSMVGPRLMTCGATDLRWMMAAGQSRAVPGITGQCRTLPDTGQWNKSSEADDTMTRAQLTSPSPLTGSIGVRLIFPSIIMSYCVAITLQYS